MQTWVSISGACALHHCVPSPLLTSEVLGSLWHTKRPAPGMLCVLSAGYNVYSTLNLLNFCSVPSTVVGKQVRCGSCPDAFLGLWRATPSLLRGRWDEQSAERDCWHDQPGRHCPLPSFHLCAPFCGRGACISAPGWNNTTWLIKWSQKNLFGSQRSGTTDSWYFSFYWKGYKRADLTPYCHRGVCMGEILSGCVEVFFGCIPLPFCSSVPPSIRWGD